MKPNGLEPELLQGLQSRNARKLGFLPSQEFGTLLNILILLCNRQIHIELLQPLSATLKIYNDCITCFGALQIPQRYLIHLPILSYISPKLHELELLFKTLGSRQYAEFFKACFGVEFNKIGTGRSQETIVVQYGNTTVKINELSFENESEALHRVLLALCLLPEKALAEIQNRGLLLGKLKGTLYDFYSEDTMLLLPCSYTSNYAQDKTPLYFVPLRHLQDVVRHCKERELTLCPIGFFEDNRTVEK